MVKTLEQAYKDARQLLLSVEDEQQAGYMARQLLCCAASITPEQLIAHRNEFISEEISTKLDFLLARALKGEPLAYLLGQWEFYGLPLYVDKNVLIPRDDTCAVAALAINRAIFLDKAPRILDLCTGSGCIGLAVASRVPDARVTLADISKEALAVAKKNIALNHMTGRVNALQADALKEPSSFLGKFDMIVSNPPYITTQEMQELPRSVSDYEPHLALHGGSSGLDFYENIAKNYKNALKSGGFMAFEFGMGQGDAVCAILKQNGYTILERSRDYNNIERAVIAQFGRKDDNYGNEKDSL